MEDTKPTTGDWSDAVSQASDHVVQRDRAIEEAAEGQKPKSKGPLLAAVALIFACVIVWDVQVLTRPPPDLSATEEALHLRWFVAEAVGVIEDFRDENGQLPTRADLGDQMDEEVFYAVRGEAYVVGLDGERITVEYDGTVPLDEWVPFESTASEGGSS